MRLMRNSLQAALGARSSDPTIDLFLAAKSDDKHFHQWLFADDGDPLGLPVAVIPAQGDFDAIFADVATYYPSWSPLSSAIYVLGENLSFLEESTGVARIAPKVSQRSCAAAVGLAIGETMSVAPKPHAEAVTYSASRRSLAYCLARSHAIHPAVPLHRVAARWMGARELSRMDVPLEVSASVLWISQQLRFQKAPSAENSPLRSAVQRFLIGDDDQRALLRAFIEASPVIESLLKDLSGPFDNRMLAFERIAAEVLNHKTWGTELGGICLGYFCNQLLPGSLSHFGALARYQTQFPSVHVWYALFGSLSANFDWQGIFGGVGFKLVRDIGRSFSYLDRPECDISIEEFEVLSRLSLKTSVLKPSQQKSLTI